MSDEKQYRHLRLKVETHSRLKRQAATNNRTIIAFLDLLALRWEQILLEHMTQDERARYLDCQMTFEECERIRQRKKTEKTIASAKMIENVA